VTVLPIVTVGDPVLRERAREVALEELRAPETQRLIDDMIDTMYAAPGVGLAAPQVGVAKRVCVIDLSVGKRGGELLTLVNPEFVGRDGMQLEEEGCLSLPGFNATVARPATALVRAMDRHGHAISVEGQGLLARALQHELDHLDGVLFVDRLRGIRRELIVRKVRKLDRAGKW